MSLHASLEEVYAGTIVRFLFEFKRATVLHELEEFAGVTLAQVLQRRLNLLFLDVVVLFILGSPWQALPRQLTFD